MIKPKRDNYAIQTRQAQERFLTYDQQELIARCRLRHDEDYFYIRFLGSHYRICRHTGSMERREGECWLDGNSFNEVLTILDWLCDSKPDRYITGRWINPVTSGPSFHTGLQEGENPNAAFFDAHPEAFCAACLALGGEEYPGADRSFAIELVDGLRILVQLWHGDEEFPPRVCCLWDANTYKYIRYETTWYATGLLLQRIRKHMQ